MFQTPAGEHTKRKEPINSSIHQSCPLSLHTHMRKSEKIKRHPHNKTAQAQSAHSVRDDTNTS
jgi:hypothetical protein